MSLQYRGRIFRNASAIIAARIESRETGYALPGVPFKQSDFASISYSVYDTVTGVPVVNNGVSYSALPLTVSAVIFDTLQSWSQDSLGCNFLYTVSPAAFPQANQEYQVEVRFVLADGRIGFAAFDATTEKVYSS